MFKMKLKNLIHELMYFIRHTKFCYNLICTLSVLNKYLQANLRIFILDFFRFSIILRNFLIDQDKKVMPQNCQICNTH